MSDVSEKLTLTTGSCVRCAHADASTMSLLTNGANQAPPCRYSTHATPSRTPHTSRSNGDDGEDDDDDDGEDDVAAARSASDVSWSTSRGGRGVGTGAFVGSACVL